MVTIVFPCCTYVSSVMMSSWHFSTSGFNIRFPKTPQNENKNLKKNSSDYFHILHIVEFWCDFKMFVGPWSIYIYIKCLWVLLTNVYWFRATGGYICGCGRPSNLVVSPVRSTYGRYYGLVVVMPPRPRPQTLHRSHDNLKNPYRIASIFYM